MDDTRIAARYDAQIAGYTYGQVPRSPVGLKELRELEATVGFTDDDRACLLRASVLFEQHAEALVDGWRKIIGSQPHLAHWFYGPDQKPDEAYKAAVKRRFVRWIVDLASRQFDQAWLDYQHEIGLRHTPGEKEPHRPRRNSAAGTAAFPARLHRAGDRIAAALAAVRGLGFR